MCASIFKSLTHRFVSLFKDSDMKLEYGFYDGNINYLRKTSICKSEQNIKDNIIKLIVDP